jgi:hypothetical protein
LASYNLASSVSNLFGVRGRVVLAGNIQKVRPAGQRVIEDHLAIIDHLDEQIKALKKSFL